MIFIINSVKRFKNLAFDFSKVLEKVIHGGLAFKWKETVDLQIFWIKFFFFDIYESKIVALNALSFSYADVNTGTPIIYIEAFLIFSLQKYLSIG